MQPAPAWGWQGMPRELKYGSVFTFRFTVLVPHIRVFVNTGGAPAPAGAPGIENWLPSQYCAHSWGSPGLGATAASVLSVTYSATLLPTVEKCKRCGVFLLTACIRHLWAMFDALPSAPRRRIPSIVVVSVGIAKAETTSTIAITTISSTRLKPALEGLAPRVARCMLRCMNAPSSGACLDSFGIAFVELRQPCHSAACLPASNHDRGNRRANPRT